VLVVAPPAGATTVEVGATACRVGADDTESALEIDVPTRTPATVIATTTTTPPCSRFARWKAPRISTVPDVTTQLK
jgi:hypothetical protein